MVASDSAFGNGGLVSLAGAAVISDATAAHRRQPLSLDGTVNFFGVSNLTFTGAATLTGGRTISVMDAPQTVNFSGGIGEGVFGTQTLTKGGLGTLELSGANTYTGATTINTDGGTLLFKDGGTLLNNVNTITVNPGGVLQVDDSGAQNLADRLTDQATIALAGGTLRFVGAGRRLDRDRGPDRAERQPVVHHRVGQQRRRDGAESSRPDRGAARREQRQFHRRRRGPDARPARTRSSFCKTPT